MINLYVMNVSPFEDSSLFSKGLSFIDEERRSKVNNLKKQEVKKLSLGAGLLLLYGLNHFCGRLPDACGEKDRAECRNKPEDKTPLKTYEVDLRGVIGSWNADAMANTFHYSYGEHGKPYVSGEDPIFFSLSHSGEYVLLAVSDSEIGADIQLRIRKDYEHMAKHFMTQTEYELWCKQLPGKQRELFYQIWTGKEAYLKLTGEGMTAGFQTVCLDAGKQTMADVRTPDKNVETMWFELEDYQIAVCQFT